MGDRGHNRHGPKRGGCCAPFAESWDPVYTMCSMAWAEVYFRTKWRLYPFSRLATIDMGQKLGGVVMPFFLGVAGSISNTESHGPRPTSMPTGILVHPAVWQQRTSAENKILCPFRGAELGPHLTQCRVGRRLPPHHAAS